MTLYPRASGELIAKLAKHLTIKPEGIKRLSQEIINRIQSGELNIKNFTQNAHHPKSTDSHAIDWIFLCDTLNFCFWTPIPNLNNKWTIDGHTGYFALTAAINRAMKNGCDITNPAFYSTITEDEFSNIFHSDDTTRLQLIPERVRCLHDVGQTLLDKYNGTFENCIRKANGSARSLLDLIVNEFDCYKDEADYEGHRVGIYKRAQILIGDIWSCFRGKGLGRFDDIQDITMFADYRVPQVLIHFGALEYNSKLLEDLKQEKHLSNGSTEEVEIRCASIYIVEQIKDQVLKELREKHPEIPTTDVNAILIDHFLWDYRRKYAKELEYIPFHKTVCIYY